MTKTAAVKRWEEAVREYGLAVPGEGWPELHHVAGRTYKQNKILVGPWFILLLPWQYHGVLSNDPANVTHYPKRFVTKFGTQRELFANMVNSLQEIGVEVPSPEIITAIQATKF
jgi:hypothetical protein